MGSRLVPIAAALILVGALGGTAYLWLQSSSATREGVRPVGGVAGPVPERADLARPAETPSPDEVPQATRQVVESTPLPEPAPGAARAVEAGVLVVRGRVVDRDGKPVPDARVYASNQTGFPVDWDDAPPLPFLKHQVTRTDAKGGFELRGLRAGPLRLAARAPGYAPYDDAELTLPKGEEAELEPVVLNLGAVLSGRVVASDGSPVQGAELSSLPDTPTFFFGGPQGSPLAETAADGSFRIDELACGAWRLLVDHPDHPARIVEGLAERPGEEVSGLLIELERGEVVAGRVEGIPAAERGHLTVRALPSAEALGPRAFLGIRSAPVETDGQFVVRGLSAGRSYDLQLRRDEQDDDFFFGASRSRRTRVDAGDRGVVIQYMPAASISFRVKDARTGQPVEEFLVSAGVGWARPLLDENKKPLTTHPDGRVLVDDLRPSNPDDRVTLQIRATGYESYERSDLTVRTGETLELGDILLQPKPVVRVTVLDQSTGEPVAGARVGLDPMPEPTAFGERRMRIEADLGGGLHGEAEGGGRRATTDENGVAVLTSLEGERARLSASASGFAPGTLDDVYLPPGQVVDQTVSLLHGGTVAITCLDADDVPVRGARVEHRDPSALSSGLQVMQFGAGHEPNVTDGEGKIVFEHLAPGVHAFRMAEGGQSPFFLGNGEAAISISGAGGDGDEGWIEVDVQDQATTPLLLRASPRGTLAGRVFEAGKPLAGATLRLRPEDEGSDTPRLRFPGMSQGPEARSNGAGEYELKDVKAGRYVMTIEHPTRRMPSELPVRVARGKNEQDVDLPVSILAGRAVDEEGQPLAGLRVTAERKRSESGPRIMRSFVMVTDGGDAVMSSGEELGEAVYTDSNGEYELRGVMPDVDLVVKAEGDQVQPGESDTVQVRPNEVRRGVDLELEAGGSIEVEAFLADGSPARFCIVRASYADDAGEEVEPEVSFLRSGSTTLQGLRPGRWKVSVERAGPGGGDEVPPVEKTVEVRARETVKETFTL